jgi:hypothetical protein
MNIAVVAAALKRIHGVSIIQTESTDIIAKGYWSLSNKTILAKNDSHLPQEMILAHELSHLTTDLKIEKNPSAANLARGVIFQAAVEGQSLNSHLKNSALPKGYEEFFAIDEPHALAKQIRVAEALARKVNAEGGPKAVRFLMSNPKYRGNLRQFLASSRVFLKLTLDYLNTERENLDIDYNRKPLIHEDYNIQKPSIDYVGELFQVRLLVPSAVNLPDILVYFSLYWSGNHEDIPKHSAPYLAVILKQALEENAKLTEKAKNMTLISNRELLH